ncbi:hypothetical protein ACFOKI_01390 [Sphingomonas qilianensis]
MNMNFAAAAIEGRRNVLEWRDRHLIATVVAINRACQDAWPIVEEKLSAITWRSVLTEADAYVTREIDPIIAEAVNPAAQRVIIQAQDELYRIVEHQLALKAILVGVPADADPLAGRLDMVIGLAPILGGIGLAAALPSAAVISGSVAFGLIATSAISAPILLSGIAIAGVGIATGVLQTSRIRENHTERLRTRIRQHMNTAVFETGREQADVSVVAQLQAVIRAAAVAALEGIDNAH